MVGKFILKGASGGKFMFNLEAGNGETILTSQRYTSKSAAKDGIEAVRKNAGLEERYDRRESKAGQPYFVLLAANREPIGTSQMYSSKSAMETGISSVKQNGPIATIVDETAETVS